MISKSGLAPREFQTMRDFIKNNCGISISKEKEYLLETRLTTLMVESGCKNFIEFHTKAVADKTGKLKEKIIDAMTTNETLWFRDTSPFMILEDVLLKEYSDILRSGKKNKIKIWCAASSTGQEPYSIAMTIHEYIRKKGGIRPEQFEIIATDISTTALYMAMAGRYDGLAITRGLGEDMKRRYFEQYGKVWGIKPEIKKMVTFKKLNLQEPYTIIGKPDIVFIRNVLIYFSTDLKKMILNKIAQMLKPDGYLFLGASESIINYSTAFQMMRYTRGLYYKVKP